MSAAGESNNREANAYVVLVLGEAIELDGLPNWGVYDTLVAAQAAIPMALEGYAKS